MATQRPTAIQRIGLLDHAAMPGRRRAVQPTAARVAVRRHIGKLRDSRVRPATLSRYHAAVVSFLNFCHSAGFLLAATDEVLCAHACEYIEHLWDSGAPINAAGDTLSGIQHYLSRRAFLQGAWRLLNAWRRLEPPVRAPPLPAIIATGMAAAAIACDMLDLGVTLFLGFVAFLRTGELLSLTANQVTLVPHEKQMILNLGLTKSGRRRGTAEFVIADDPVLYPWIALLLSSRAPHEALYRGTPYAFRRQFNLLLNFFGIEYLRFRPYSLRRGGATCFFRMTHSLDLTLERGRWLHSETARIYLTEAVQSLQQLQVPPEALHHARILSEALLI